MNYSNYTLKELKAIAAKRGINADTYTAKKPLIELLVEDDNAMAKICDEPEPEPQPEADPDVKDALNIALMQRTAEFTPKSVPEGDAVDSALDRELARRGASRGQGNTADIMSQIIYDRLHGKPNRF